MAFLFFLNGFTDKLNMKAFFIKNYIIYASALNDWVCVSMYITKRILFK